MTPLNLSCCNEIIRHGESEKQNPVIDVSIPHVTMDTKWKTVKVRKTSAWKESRGSNDLTCVTSYVDLQSACKLVPVDNYD